MTAPAADAVAPDAGFVFIFGCPRSGTSLLQVLMNNAFPIAFPLEGHFIPPFERYHRLWGDLGRARNRARLLDAVYQFVEIFDYQILWARSRGGADKTESRYSLLATRPLAAEIVARSASFSDLLVNLFRAYAQLHGRRRFGDKSGFFDPVPVERIARAVPDLKVIHLIRDGRDVCISWRKAWFGPSSVAEAAELWVAHVRQKRDWGRRHPERYLELRYEDLLADVRPTIERIGRFIGETPTAESLDLESDAMAKLLATTDAHALLAGGVAEQNTGKWRTELEADEIRTFERHAGALLGELGYEVRFPAMASPDLGERLRRTGDRLRPCVNGPFWMRKVKYHLPPLIRAAQLVGVWLPRLANRRRAP